MRFLTGRKIHSMFLVLMILTIGITVSVSRYKALASSSLVSSPAQVVFNGYDTSGKEGLWVTDGTTVGTKELSNSGNDVRPGDITSFGKQALFGGYDVTKGSNELWITNGTASGTRTITSVTNAYGGLNPSDITVFGNQAVFRGTDANGSTGLWVTDGITAQELNIAGAGSGGLLPTVMTVLGNQVLFDGYDTNKNYELWVTNGTAGGTKELTQISNSYGGLGPIDITVFGSQALFRGIDGNNTAQMWITNGSTVTAVKSNVNGVLSAVDPSEITVLGSRAVFREPGSLGYDLWVTDGTDGGTQRVQNIQNASAPSPNVDQITLWGNKALFSGNDTSHNRELWATDGTVGGTTELTHAANGVTFSGHYPGGITVFGNQVLFYGYDSTGNNELWDTSGTPNGTTTQLTTSPTYVGPYLNFNFPDITVFGNQAVFDARNTIGYGLWVTNGQAGGTKEVTNIVQANSTGIAPSNMATLAGSGTPSPTPTPPPVLTAPSVAEYLLAANAAYGLDISNFTPPSGMTLLPENSQVAVADGFEAVVLKDSSGNIIIANEGAEPGPVIGKTTTYEQKSVIAEGLILINKTPAALKDAVLFANGIRAQYGSSSKIYVTGHDLGGVEAEAEAQSPQAAITGGATFGATGLPLNTSIARVAIFTNYVDFGDPLGNYASDPSSSLSSQTVGIMYHYGQIQTEGSPANASDLQAIVLTKKVLAPFSNKLVGEVGKKIPPVKAFTTAYTSVLYASIGAYLLAATHYYHGIAHYAVDLNVNLTPKESVTPAISLEEYTSLYGASDAQSITNAKVATVNTSGVLVSPEMTISFNPQTQLLTGEKYVYLDGSVYTASLNTAETFTTIQINQSGGVSYQINFDSNSNKPWSSDTNFYQGTNDKGLITESVFDWDQGGSQVQLFTGLPRGFKEEIQNFSGPDGTGKLLSTQFK